MSLIYKCDFFGTTAVNENNYPEKRVVTISGNQINGIDVNIKLTVELGVPAISGRIHANNAAWKEAAGHINDWLDATFP